MIRRVTAVRQAQYSFAVRRFARAFVTGRGLSRFLGLDVHAETIAIAVAEPGGEVRSLGTIANREESVRKFIGKLGPAEQLRACYEAGPTGFVLYWQLAQMGVECAETIPRGFFVGFRVHCTESRISPLARTGSLFGAYYRQLAPFSVFECEFLQDGPSGLA